MSVLKTLLYIPFFYVGMETEAYTVLGVLVVFDIITGIIKSARLKGVKSITSKKAIFGIIYKTLIIIIPLLIAVVGKSAGIDLHDIAKGFLTMLLLFEGYSILGNIYSIGTGEEVEEIDAITWSIKKVREIIGGFIDKLK